MFSESFRLLFFRPSIQCQLLVFDSSMPTTRNEEPQLRFGMEMKPPPKYRIKVSNVVGDAIATVMK